MNNKKLFKSRVDKPISGVFGGLAIYLEMDANILRLIFVFFSLVTAIIPFFLLYLIAAFIIPYEDNHEPPDLVNTEEKSID